MNKPVVLSFIGIFIVIVSGLLFSKIRQLNPQAKVVFVTGHEDVEKSVIAQKNGVLDILSKPILAQTLTNVIKQNNC